MFAGICILLVMYIKQRAIASEAIERHASVLNAYENMRNNFKEIIKAQKKTEAIRKLFNFHLVSNIPTTDENTNNVYKINRLMKKSNSAFRLEIKYRSPKVEDTGYVGGFTSKANSKFFSVYLRKRK